MKYESGQHSLQFDCEWGVFLKGGKSSICYTTSKQRADFIATALNAVDRLPKTADQKPITPLMRLWCINQREQQVYWIDVETVSFIKDGLFSVIGKTQYEEIQDFNPTDCYSTHEAAESAMKGGG